MGVSGANPRSLKKKSGQETCSLFYLVLNMLTVSVHAQDPRPFFLNWAFTLRTVLSYWEILLVSVNIYNEAADEKYM